MWPSRRLRMTETALVRSDARGLGYRPVGHPLGRTVEVHDLAIIEEAVRRAFGPDLPEGCRLLGAELQTCEATVARYGILELKFSAPAGLLEGEAHTGVPLLRELGFLSTERD